MNFEPVELGEDNENWLNQYRARRDAEKPTPPSGDDVADDAPPAKV